MHGAESRLTAPGCGRRWELRLLGPPALAACDPNRLVRLRPNDAALLAVVALSAATKADHLAAMLWPLASASQANASLRQRLFRLRRETKAKLVSTGPLLQLSDDLATDLDASLLRLRENEHSACGGLLAELEFDELPELAHWLRAERQRWNERRAHVLAEAVAACEQEGSLARGLVYAQRMVEVDPIAEFATRALMRMHYLRGDGAAAIAAFERLEQGLKDELGARPSAETIELMALLERGAVRRPVHYSSMPASLLRPPMLIGRERELGRLQEAWSASRVFLLIGEAGIGKSRLLHDFAADQPRVASVQARPGDASITYAVLARLLRVVLGLPGAVPAAERRGQLALVLPELGAPVEVAGQAQRWLLSRAVESTLVDAVAAGMQAAIVDDLHFADEASIEFILALVEAPALATLRWGFAQRADHTGAALLQMRQTLEDAGRVETTQLQALDMEQLRALLQSLDIGELDPGQLAPSLQKHTGGNPMFVLETLKDMVLAMPRVVPAMPVQAAVPVVPARLPQPATVGALVERRLAQLSPPALRLARTAALAGVDFSVELAAAVLHAHPLDIVEPWRELETAQVIRNHSFAHDLIFEATLASVPQPIARTLHGQIAAYLASRDTPPERLAPHWAGAADWLHAGESYAAAAQRAERASQRVHEVAYWKLATQAFEAGGLAERAFESRCASVHALIIVQGVTHAHAVIDDLLAAAATDGQRAAAWTAKATAALMAADHVTGMAAAVQAQALTQSLPSVWVRFEAARLHAVSLALAGRSAEALAVIEPWRAPIGAQSDPKLAGRFWADYAYVLNSARRLRDTAHALQQAIEHAQVLGDLAELATLTSNLATVRGNLGQVPGALALARRSLALQAQLGATDGPEGAVVETYVGLYCGRVGRYDEALQRLDAAIACFTRDRQVLWTAVASNHKAQLLIELGQFARAQQALGYEQPPIQHVRARGATIAARLARASGHSGAAQIQEALALLAGVGDPHVRMHALLEQAQGDDGDAAEPQRYDEVLQMAEQLEFAGIAMKARLLRAWALSRAGDTVGAAAQMRELIAQLPQVQPADLYPAQAWWIAAHVFDANANDAEALRALAQGVHWVRKEALPHVPEAFVDSFLQRNVTNRALLTAADRRLAR
jgi:DNA-binding SARP family transcriptional activator/tetratricopeptide (TPR) repeat protein